MFFLPFEDSMDMPTTTPIVRTHPRACAACSRAKAKCVIGENGKCQRCNRLERQCEPVVAQPRSQPRKRRSEPASRSQHSQVAKLEEKLDGLVTLLQKTHERSGNEPLTSLNFNTVPIPSKSSSRLTTASPISHGEIPEPGWIHLDITNSTPNVQPSETLGSYWAVIPDRVDFSCDEATVLLNRWRNEMSPMFPFIFIPPSISAQELRRDRPFLLNAILAVASSDSAQQLAIGKWLMRELTERMVINGERNLDLLLGVLTYTGWCFYNFYNVPQLTCLLSLAMALVFDQGLNRPLQSLPANRTIFENALRETPHPAFTRHGLSLKSDRTLEDRRVILGMFYITSTASKFFRSKIDPLKVTPYIHECLENLDKAPDCPTDNFATFLVRLQIIVERISHGPWNTDCGTPEQSISSPPTILYIKSIQEQLKDVKAKMAPEIGTRGYLLMHYYHAEECLYEAGLSRSPALSNYPSHDFYRLEMLHACLQSNKMFFETFFAIPEFRYLSFSLATWTHVTHSIMILQLLVSFEHPDWNLAYVRQTIDLMVVMDRIIEGFNKVEGPIFARTASKMATVRAHMQQKMVDAEGAGLGSGSLNGIDADMGRPWEPYDFLDESWLADALGPIEF